MILLSDQALDDRRVYAAGALAPLAESLHTDLQSVIARPLFIPEEKARLTRAGGRCPDDGTMLDFDPFAPRAHRCRACARVFDTDAHYQWWVMGYQLWLAERTVHASVLHMLRGDERAATFARTVLERYADLYARYPNQDNVLGPTRPFFSTYLESICCFSCASQHRRWIPLTATRRSPTHCANVSLARVRNSFAHTMRARRTGRSGTRSPFSLRPVCSATTRRRAHGSMPATGCAG